MEEVLRSLLTSVVALLTLTTLLCGGCVSCPQFFMFPGAKQDCCNAGHCKKSTTQKSGSTKECNRMPLDRHGFVQVHADLPAAITATCDLMQPAVVHSPSVITPELVEHSPPELHILNSSFLI